MEYIRFNFVKENLNNFGNIDFTYGDKNLKFVKITKSYNIITFIELVPGQNEVKFTLRNSLNYVKVNEKEHLLTCLFFNNNNDEDTNQKCNICLDSVETIKISCGHDFCKICIVKISAKCGKKCPCCRKHFNIMTEHQDYIYDYGLALEEELTTLKKKHNRELDRLYAKIYSLEDQNALLNNQIT